MPSSIPRLGYAVSMQYCSLSASVSSSQPVKDTHRQGRNNMFLAACFISHGFHILSHETHGMTHCGLALTYQATMCHAMFHATIDMKPVKCTSLLLLAPVAAALLASDELKHCFHYKSVNIC